MENRAKVLMIETDDPYPCDVIGGVRIWQGKYQVVGQGGLDHVDSAHMPESVNFAPQSDDRHTENKTERSEYEFVQKRPVLQIVSIIIKMRTATRNRSDSQNFRRIPAAAETTM